MVNGKRLQTIELKEATLDRDVADEVKRVEFSDGRQHVLLLSLPSRLRPLKENEGEMGVSGYSTFQEHKIEQMQGKQNG